MNIVLDLVFVIVFNMGIAGVAYATIISQFVSAILILILLTKSKENYRFVWKDLRIDLPIVKQICSVGLPAGLQQAITSFSNVYVQSYINGFGSSCMAGWSSYSKIDMFVMLPMMSVAQATTTFVSQNIGAGNLERAKKGTNTSLAMSAAISLGIAVVLWMLAPQFASLFSQDVEVVYFCTLFLRQNIFFLATCCLTQVYSGTLRGVGNSTTPMILMLISYVAFRQVYLFIVKQVCYTPNLVGFGYPAGWMVCALLTTLYYHFSGWDKKLKTSK